MENNRHYEFDGLEFDIPVYFDTHTRRYIEDYSAYINTSTYTPAGQLVVFAGDDPCPAAALADPSTFADCSSCQFYRPINDHSLLGICCCESNLRKDI